MTNDLSTEATTIGRMTHFYCSVCDAIRPVLFEGACHEDKSGLFVGGDVMCTVCPHIIATVYIRNSN